MAVTASPPPTLIFYEPPLLVDGGSPELAALAAAGSQAKKSLKGTVANLDDVVNSILPPRMWSQPDGTTWMQYASKAPPSRPELAQLHAALDQRLQQRQARGQGLCAVRSELYSQLFGAWAWVVVQRGRKGGGGLGRGPHPPPLTPTNAPPARALLSLTPLQHSLFPPTGWPADELIRQVTLDLPERGLLLLRIRDEIRMTMDAYRTLYESSITFGVRKQLQAEEGLPELEATLAELLEKKKAAEALVLATKSKLELMERRLLERRALEDKQRAEEIVYVGPSQTTPAALPAPPHKHAHTHTHICLPSRPARAATSSTNKSTWTPS
jgi:hypothetical protein